MAQIGVYTNMSCKDRHKNRIAHNRIEMAGKKIGKLTVLSEVGKKSNKCLMWLCKCDCGNEIQVKGTYLRNGDTKSCGCISKGNAHNRTGYKNISGSYWYHVKSNASRRGIPFEITEKYAHELFEKQNKICALTDEPIELVLNYRDDYLQQTASLDRIDNSKGYVEGNVWWVHKEINIMRNQLNIDKFVVWCEKIVLSNKRKLHENPNTR